MNEPMYLADHDDEDVCPLCSEASDETSTYFTDGYDTTVYAHAECGRDAGLDSSFPIRTG